MVKIRLKLGFALPQKLFLFFSPRVLTPIPVSSLSQEQKVTLLPDVAKDAGFFNAHCCTDSHTISTFSYGPAYYSICFSAFLSRYLLSFAYFDPAFT